MKHNESIIQSVPRWWAGGAMLRLCRTAVALIAIITRLRPTDFVGRAIILSTCSLPAIFLAGLPAVFLAGCRKEAPPQPAPTPPPYVRTINLMVVDTGLTDAYLRVRFLDTVQTRAFRLHRDGQPVLTVAAAPPDTVLLQDSLAIGRAYAYRAYRLLDTVIIDSSQTVSLTTLDSTTPEFTFQTFEFGQHSSSVFNDVAIIDDNNIWAVGEVYLDPYPDPYWFWPYNVARWDGSNWNFLRVMFPGVCGGSGTAPTAADAIFAFAPNHVWIVSGAFVARWNGNDFTILCIPDTLLGGLINKVWGVSPSSVYAVGNSGTIVYWNGTLWQRIESGTTVDIHDVWGVVDSLDNRVKVLAAASNRYTTGERKLLRIHSDGTVENLSWLPQQRLHAVWFRSLRRIFVAGGGVYVGVPGSWTRVQGLPSYFATRLAATAENNVFVVGAFGLCAHFNGATWRSYAEVMLPNGTLEGLSVFGTMMAAVGQNGNRAIVVLGRKQTH